MEHSYLTIWKIGKYFGCLIYKKWKNKFEKKIIEDIDFLSFLSFAILKFWNIGRSTFRREIWNYWNFDILQDFKFWKFANFRNWTISEIWLFYEFVDDGNLIIYKIVKFGNLKKKFQFGKPKFDSKNWQISELFVLRYSSLLVISSILIFSLWNVNPHPQKFQIRKIS